MEPYRNKQVIKNWAEDDRPREKLMLKGKGTLSNAELLAILISSGTKSKSALELAKELLESASNNLPELATKSLEELTSVKGIGSAKAITIISALELGKRQRSAETLVKEKISGSRDVFEIMQEDLSYEPYEKFWIVLLDRSNKLIRKICISEGGLSGTVADPKKIFKLALEARSSALILCHNHPSGNQKPSEADIRLTRKMKEAGNLLDLPVLDHVIIAREIYFSFADEGML
jgi:DNA repair protein RadC